MTPVKHLLLLTLSVLVLLGIVGTTLYLLNTAPPPPPSPSPVGAGGAPGQPTQAGQASGPAQSNGIADPESAEELLSSARTMLNTGRTAAALALLESGTARYPQDQALLATYGEALMFEERMEEALVAYQQAIFLGPDRAEYRDIAGTIAFTLGDYELADAQYARAQVLDPSNPRYPLYRAQVQRRLGQDEAARASLVMVTRLDPTISEAWASLAGIALDAGRPTVAQQHIEKARELEPNTLAYIVTEAIVHRRQNDPERAATLLLSIDETVRANDDAVLRELGLCFGLMGQPGRAVEEYRGAVTRFPNDAGLRLALAEWYERTGDEAAALREARRARDLGSEKATPMVERLSGDDPS